MGACLRACLYEPICVVCRLKFWWACVDKQMRSCVFVVCVRVRACVCVCVCVRACMRAYKCEIVRACVVSPNFCEIILMFCKYLYIN